MADLAQESQLVKALEEEAERSMVLMGEIEASRNLILEVVATLVNHGRIGNTWRRLFREKTLGDLEKIIQGYYLTKEMSDGEAEDGSTEAG